MRFRLLVLLFLREWAHPCEDPDIPLQLQHQVVELLPFRERIQVPSLESIVCLGKPEATIGRDQELSQIGVESNRAFKKLYEHIVKLSF